MALLPQVFADNVTAFLFVVRGGVPDNRVYVVDCFPVDVKYCVTVFLCLHELDCMTNKFRHIIVRHIFSGGVGDLTHERGIEPKMPVKVDRAFYIGVIVPDGSILSVNALTQGVLQKIREHKHDEVKDVFPFVVMIQIEKAER